MSKYMKENGVQIYISWSDYNAICAALSEMETNCEGSDEEYIQNIQNDLKGLRNVIRKFKNAKYNKDKN